jgi:glycosyltransferase involved in cell wall biosynthesis
MAGRYKIREVLNDPRLDRTATTPPLVTVVVTSFNYSKYIVDCLRSISSQDYRSFHVVVVDDYSTDESIRLVQNFIESPESNDRFELVCHDENRGQLAAFKTGLEHSRGVFVVYVDADDLLLPDFISSHIRVHLGVEPVAFTSSDQYQINERNEIISGHHADLQAKGKLRVVNPGCVFRPFWIWATTSSMMFRKSVLELVMPDSMDHFRICADNYISHFANIIGGSILVPEVHGCYRRHGMNCFSSNSLVGGSHPTGNMKNHPKHDNVRMTILETLIQKHESFSAVLSEGVYFRLLAQTGTGLEVFRISRNYGQFCAERGTSFQLKLFLYSKSLRVIAFMRRIFSIAKDLLR